MRKIFSLLSYICFFAYSYASYPIGYYSSLYSKSDAQLKTALHDIICQDTTHYLTYGSGANHTWQGFYSTDRDTINNTIIDMYSSNIVSFPTNYIALNYPGFGSTEVIEHSVPKSWWQCDINHPDCAAEDLNHLYPADGPMNSSKGDDPLGIVVTPTKDNGVSKRGIGYYDGYSGGVFEPADQYKGDFARSYFYIATAYEHYFNRWDLTKTGIMFEADTYPTLKTGAVNLLLQWHRQDPVSQKELTRVEKVYTIQHNRNPYIDYPELIEYIWGNKVGSRWGITTDMTENSLENIKIILDKTSNSIKLSYDETIPVNISIYTVDGKLILRKVVNTNTNINIPQLNSGIYFVSVISNNQVVTIKVIK